MSVNWYRNGWLSRERESLDKNKHSFCVSCRIRVPHILIFLFRFFLFCFHFYNDYIYIYLSLFLFFLLLFFFYFYFYSFIINLMVCELRKLIKLGCSNSLLCEFARLIQVIRKDREYKGTQFIMNCGKQSKKKKKSNKQKQKHILLLAGFEPATARLKTGDLSTELPPCPFCEHTFYLNYSKIQLRFKNIVVIG